MGLFKSIKKIAGFAAPIVGNFIAPGIGGAIGGALGGALGGGGLKDIAGGALGGYALGGAGKFGGALSNSLGLGLGNAASGALGGALLGTGSGALLGGGKGALIGGALGGVGGYVQGAGGVKNALSEAKSSLGFGADTSSVTGSTGAVGGGASSYGNDLYGDLEKINASSPTITDRLKDSITGSVSPAGGSDAEVFARYGSNPTVQSLSNSNLVPAVNSPTATSLLTPLASAGIGTIANQRAEDQLLDSQEQAANLLMPYQNQTFDATDLENDPGYQFQLAEGNKAIDRAASARGGYFSGQALIDAADYSKGLTDTTVNNAYGRFAGDLNRNIGVASGLGDIYTNQGNVRANATTNLGNIFTGSLAAATGGRGVNSNGQVVDPNGISNDMLMQLLRQRGLA